MPTLYKIDFPELRGIKQLLFSSLPLLSDFTSKEIEGLISLVIMSTALRSLNNIRSMETGANLVLTGNLNLNDIFMAVEPAEFIQIESNGYTLTVDFPTLRTVRSIPGGSVTFNNCTSLSLPSLATVNTSLTFAGNFFDRIHLPELQAVNSLEVVENARLRTIDLPKLESVEGSVLLSGDLDE